MLVVDENQQSNFDECLWQGEFILFFLALMNLGIPVLLLGNPLAFGSLESMSQVMKRFSAAGYHHLLPAASAKEDWWQLDFLPGLSRYQLCEGLPSIDDIRDKTFVNTGGIPGLHAALFAEGQRIALRRGGTRADLTLEDLAEACDSPTYSQLAKIARQVTGESAGNQFVDLPSRRSSPVNAQSSDPTAHDAGDLDPAVLAQIRKLTAKYARTQKAKAAEAIKYQKAVDGLAEGDLRVAQTTLEILAGFFETKAERQTTAEASAA